MSKQFLNEKVLDEFPTICAEMFVNMLLKEGKYTI